MENKIEKQILAVKEVIKQWEAGMLPANEFQDAIEKAIGRYYGCVDCGRRVIPSRRCFECN